MTTSVLKTFLPGGLCEHDLQTLSDFALEAPLEWRYALQELLTVYEQAEKHLQATEDAKTKEAETAEAFDEMKKRLKNATQRMRRWIDKLETGRKANSLTKGDIDTITGGIQKAFDDLEEIAKEPAAPPAPDAASRLPSSPG
jgi:chromosome segregation ATPase